MVPFKCTLGLYTHAGKHLAYLNRLVTGSVVFQRQHWSCDIDFVANSQTLLYELLERNIEVGDKTLDEVNAANEPMLVRVFVQSKFSANSRGDNGEEDDILHSIMGKYYEMPFIPAFYIQTKKIELPIVKHAYGVDNFSLVIRATRQLHSHLILSTNCPQYVQIKPAIANSERPSDK